MAGKCFNCGSRNIIETKISLAGGIKARAWKCVKCGEAILDSGDAQKALLYNKLKRGVKVKVGMLGNSLVMRFPAEITRLTGLKKGQKITVTPKENGEISLSTA